MKKCLICEKDFTSATGKQRFCSNSCRQKNYRKEIKELLIAARLIKNEIKPNTAVFKKKQVDASIKREKPLKQELNPPEHLKGIDITIWKAENLK
jgi:hypothetical protein